jgi:hypothetical protein
MTITLIILATLFIWWICGVINIAITQAYLGGDSNFDDYNRPVVLGFCYLAGPVFTIVIGGGLLLQKPIQLGTRWGRMIGRKFEN